MEVHKTLEQRNSKNSLRLLEMVELLNWQTKIRILVNSSQHFRWYSMTTEVCQNFKFEKSKSLVRRIAITRRCHRQQQATFCNCFLGCRSSWVKFVLLILIFVVLGHGFLAFLPRKRPRRHRRKVTAFPKDDESKNLV